jgi:hypothetical protein
MQRTGTTSVGKFFRDFGYRCAGWGADKENDWSQCWYEGDYQKIFSSYDFKTANAYEDSPWWMPDFYRVLFHQFPDAKFILFTRDEDAWFQSMVRHSNGSVIGKSRIHCKVYGRELEYFELLKSGKIDESVENQFHTEKTLKLDGYAEHYKNVYRLHNLEVQDFFKRHAPEALHVGQLEDPEKWQKLGRFLGLAVPADYANRENVSSENAQDV